MKKSLFSEKNGEVDPVKIGDTVRLYSGGPLLTVGAVSESYDLLNCLWFVDFNIHSAWISARIVLPDADKDNEAYKVSWMDQDPTGNRVDEVDDAYYDCDDYDEPIEGDGCIQEEEMYSYDKDDECQELLEERTDYSDSLVRSHKTGWYYND